jgi:hypothetical protein
MAQYYPQYYQYQYPQYPYPQYSYSSSRYAELEIVTERASGVSRPSRDAMVRVYAEGASRGSRPGSGSSITFKTDFTNDTEEVVFDGGAYRVTVTGIDDDDYFVSYSPSCNGSAYFGSRNRCVITLYEEDDRRYPPYPVYPSYPSYPQPVSPVTTVPTYVPNLPSTGVAPLDAASVAFAGVILMGAAVASTPYVRRAFAAISR